MEIQSQNNINFQANFYRYSQNIKDKKVPNLFKYKTKDFENYILKQNSISTFEDDYFVLLDKTSSRMLAHGFFEFSKNKSKSLAESVERLVEIFRVLRNNPLPKIHKDNWC